MNWWLWQNGIQAGVRRNNETMVQVVDSSEAEAVDHDSKHHPWTLAILT